jgi:hypothetical protein
LSHCFFCSLLGLVIPMSGDRVAWALHQRVVCVLC